MEDSSATFDEELPVDIGNWTVKDAFGATAKTRRIRASASGLEIQGGIAIARDRIETAFLSPLKEPKVVVVDREGHRLTIHARSQKEAELLLEALHFTATEKNAVFRVLPPFHAPTVGGMLIPFGALIFLFLAKPPINVGAAIVVTFITLLLAVALKLFGRTLTVGRDGATLSSRFGKRFISYADVISMNRYSDVSTSGRRRRNEIIYSGVVLHLRGGEDLRVPIARGLQADVDLMGASQRLRDALVAWQARQPVDTDILERGGRTTQEWVSNLRALGTSDTATYRVAAVDRETLFAIVEDPVNQASSRAAAAIAISAKLDEESRGRLRKSAEGIADPKLRVAIEHVVDERDDAFAEVLDELAPETKARA